MEISIYADSAAAAAAAAVTCLFNILLATILFVG
jgi:hypothetical protein